MGKKQKKKVTKKDLHIVRSLLRGAKKRLQAEEESNYYALCQGCNVKFEFEKSGSSDWLTLNVVHRCKGKPQPSKACSCGYECMEEYNERAGKEYDKGWEMCNCLRADWWHARGKYKDCEFAPVSSKCPCFKLDNECPCKPEPSGCAPESCKCKCHAGDKKHYEGKMGSRCCPDFNIDTSKEG